MKVTVIGQWGGYPAAGGATSSYMVEEDDFTLIIDMGSGSLSKLQSYKHVNDIDAVILSHYHHDHVADIGVLQYARLVQSYVKGVQKKLPIYGHMENELAYESLTHNQTEKRSYDPSGEIKIGPFTITFLRTKHPVPCFGMRITNGENVIVYTADTAYQDEWIDFSANADLLITDCNFYEEQDGTNAGHMNSKEGAVIANKANVGELILSHLPQYGDNQQLVTEAKNYYNGKIQLAHEGLVWEK